MHGLLDVVKPGSLRVNINLNQIATSSRLRFEVSQLLEVEDIWTFSLSQTRVSLVEIAMAFKKTLQGSLAKQVI